MTNKGKVITAIVVVAVVLAGGAGFYFKGGDLMGRIKPATKEAVSACTTHQRFYSGSGLGGGSQYDFDSFLASVKNELESNNGNLVCPLFFAVFSGDEGVQGAVTCSGDEVQTYTSDNVGEIVMCNKSGPYSNVSVSVYESGGSFVHSFKMGDGNELAVEEISGPILYVDKLPN